MKSSSRLGKSPGFRNPHNLPAKVCPVCERPFVWRKKWERDWENVVYCSDACRRQGRTDTVTDTVEDSSK